jgi:hypothetical protein
VIKQLLNKAIGGYIPALRTYVDLHQGASEKVALLEASRSSDSRKYDDEVNLTDEELRRIAAGGLKDNE